MLPEMYIPKIHSYALVLERARAKVAEKGAVKAAVVGDDPVVAAAVKRAVEAGLIETVDAGGTVDKAFAMAASGEAGLVVAGWTSYKELAPFLLNFESGFVTKGSAVSHVGVIKAAKYPKLLLVSDGWVMPQPDLKAKIGLVQNIVTVASAIGVEMPRVAVLGAVEVVYPQMQATLDGAVLAKMNERGQIKGAYVDGPLSYDVAVDMHAAHSKGIKTSEVAGQADAMLTSTIEVANGIYKAMSMYGGGEVGGVIVGGKTPVAVNAASDTESHVLNSIVLGVLTA